MYLVHIAALMFKIKKFYGVRMTFSARFCEAKESVCYTLLSGVSVSILVGVCDQVYQC